MARLEQIAEQERKLKELGYSQQEIDRMSEQAKTDILDKQISKVEVRQPDQPITPKQKLDNAQAEIDAIRKQQELESISLHYENFKAREKSITDRESELIKGINSLAEDRDKLVSDREELLGKYNIHQEEYNSLLAAIKTRESEAKRIMTEAINKKSEAERIIKSQSESQKISQKKMESYTKNMSDVVTNLVDIYTSLKQESDEPLLELASLLNTDLKLIGALCNDHNDLVTTAGIISLECDRITKVCEYMQNSKKDFGELREFLLKSTEYIESALCMEWKPPVNDFMQV